MSVRIAPALSLLAVACSPEGPIEVADAAAWYRDPEVWSGPAYAGCTGVRAGGPDSIQLQFDDEGRPAARTEGGATQQVTRWSWSGEAWVGEEVRLVDHGEGTLVSSTAWQWDDGLPSGESNWPGRWSRFTYDEDGHRLEEEWSDDDGGVVDVVAWSWFPHGDGTTATAVGGSLVPRSFAWDEERRLVARSVGSTVVHYAWSGDAVETVAVEGGPTTTRAYVDGRVAFEWVDGVERRWTWTCP